MLKKKLMPAFGHGITDNSLGSNEANDSAATGRGEISIGHRYMIDNVGDE